MMMGLKPIANRDTQTLILGSFPSETSLNQGQYYANKKNHFWKLIYGVFDKEFEEDYEKRKAFLKRNKVGLWDVLRNCKRKGSVDSTIKEEQPNDFSLFISKCPRINKILACVSDKLVSMP